MIETARVLGRAALVAAALVPGVALAQQGGADAAAGRGPGSSEAPATFHLGPLLVQPYIRVGQIGFDTNVFYTRTDRQSDLSASGGPGLKITLPIRNFKPYVDANADYTWFARTAGQRRFGGTAGAGFAWDAGAFTLEAGRFFTRSYRRPNIEVDQRVLEDRWSNRVSLIVKAGGRLEIRPGFTADQSDVATGTDFLGNDLGRSLTSNRYAALLELAFRVTGKTSLIAQADNSWERFPNDATRDVDSNHFGGGIELRSETRLDMRLVGGGRLLRPKSALRGGNKTVPYAEAQATWHFGPKTRLNVSYQLDTQYTVFTTTSGLPTYENHRLSALLYRKIAQKIDFQGFGRLSTLKSDAPIVITPGASAHGVTRDDQFWEAGGDLGFLPWERLRIGGSVSYAQRQTNISDFGIRGLIVGLTIRFNP